MFKTKSIMSLIKKFGGVHMRWTMGLNKENASEGSANGDVELFAGREVSSTIRETIQNSSDVPADDKIPVKIEIKMYKVATNSLPQIAQIKEIVKNIDETDFWADNQEVQKRVGLAKQALAKEKITVVRISDFNTLGASGAKLGHQKNSPFTALTRANYVSHKSNASAAGSRGIGKNSVKGISDLRMVLFTSQTQSDGKYSSGQIDLATFAKGNQISNRINYLVGDDNEAIEGEVIDDGFIRKENGTDIRIIGVNDKYVEEFADFGLVYILENYLTAIYEEKLVVEFLGRTIDKNSLETIILGLPKSRKDEIESISGFYRALKFGKIYQLPEEFLGKYGIEQNDGTLYLKTEEKFGNKVLFTRKSGMKIYDKTYNAPDKFSGVFRATGKLNQVLRNMEDATHTEWKASLFDNSNNLIDYSALEHKYRKDIRYAKELLDDLNKFIKITLNQAFDIDDKNEMEADEISNLFYLEEKQEDKNSSMETAHQHISKVKIGKMPRKSAEGTETHKKEEVLIDDEGNIKPKEKIGKTTSAGSSSGTTAKSSTDKSDKLSGESFKVKNINIPNDWAISNTDGSMDYIFVAPKNMSKFGLLFEPVGEGKITVNPVLKAYYNGEEMQALNSGEFYILDKIKKDNNVTIHLTLIDNQPIGLSATLLELRRK